MAAAATTKRLKSPSCRRKSLGSPGSPLYDRRKMLSRSTDSFPTLLAPSSPPDAPDLLKEIMDSTARTAKIFANALHISKETKKRLVHKAPLTVEMITSHNNIDEYIRSKYAKRNQACVSESLAIKNSTRERCKDDNLSRSAGSLDLDILYKMFNASAACPVTSELRTQHSASMPDLFARSAPCDTPPDRSATATPMVTEDCSNRSSTASECEPGASASFDRSDEFCY